MVSKRLSIYGFISAAAIVGGILAGCGGSSSSVAGINPTVQTTGGITNSTGSGTAGFSSGSTPQQVQVSVNGTTQTGTLPANETIPQSGTVCAVPSGTPIISGLSLATKFHGVETAPTQSKTKPTVSNGVQGEVDVDGCDTGLTVTSNGSLSGYLFLVPGSHTITAIGPFDITDASGLNQLTVGTFNFIVTVDPDGVGSIPSALNMKLPANGGSYANGTFVNVTYPTPDFAAGTGTLTIVLDSTRTINQTKTVANGMAQFKTFQTFGANKYIPQAGVVSVTYQYNP